MSSVLEAFNKQVDKLESLEESLERIAVSCEDSAKAQQGILEELKNMRGDLLDAATSKKSVPVSVFIIMLLTCTALIAVEKLTNTNTDLHVDKRGLSIEQHNQRAE